MILKPLQMSEIATLRAIRHFRLVCGYAPTHAQLAGILGITENAARKRVYRLRDASVLKVERCKTRGIYEQSA